MTAIPGPFGSSGGKYKFLGTASLVNCYSEIQGDQGKSKIVIVPSDGMIEFTDEAETPLRNFIYLEDLDCIYEIRASSAWKTTYNGTVATTIRVGTVPGIDRVQLTRNKKSTPQVTIRTDAGLYFIENDQVHLLNDSNLQSVVSIETLGEYTLFGIESGRVYYSTQRETTVIDGLSFFTAEQSPDRLVRLIVNRGELFVGGQFTTEAFSFTGNTDTPFEFRTLIPYGFLSRDSAAECDGTIMWAGQTKTGDKAAYRLEGYSAKKISNAEVDRLISSDPSQSTILGFSFGRPGHSFYVLKGSNWTRIYDAATGEWHTRKSLGLDVWRAQYAVGAWGKVILGDQESGKLFYLDPDTFTEDGNKLSMEIIPPIMHTYPKGGRVNSINIDFLTGQGVTSTTAQGFAPKLMVSKSTNGSNSFGPERMIELGAQGEHEKKVRSHRWGRYGSKGCTWKIVITDPVGRALANLDVDVTPLNR